MEQAIIKWESLSEEEKIKEKKIALLFCILTHLSSREEIDEELLNTIDIDNDLSIHLLKNCFYIDTTNGECFAVIAPHELRDYFVDYLCDRHDDYNYSFDDIVSIFGFSKEEVENYYLPHILSDDGTVTKYSSGSLACYVVCGSNVNGFLDYKQKKDIVDWFENHVDYLFSVDKWSDLLEEDYSIIDGLYVFFKG